MAKCKGCGAEIIWVETTNGRKMPVDPTEVTIVTPVASRHSDKYRIVKGYTSHFATCPAAEWFRNHRNVLPKG